MGHGNAAVKQWIMKPNRFADLFNGCVFQGEQVILPEELEPAVGESDILLTDKKNKVREVERYRDITMRWKKEAWLVILACENQEKIHYAMPVRNMLYDSLAYVGQIQGIWENRMKGKEVVEKEDEKRKTEKKEKENNIKNRKMTSAEFLSKFTKEDRLIPVITLVFYYGVEPWDGSRDLHGMLRWGEKEYQKEVLKKYIPNYRINLIDVNNIDNLKRFHTDLQVILGMLKWREDKEKLLEYMNEKADYFRHVDEETYHFIRVALHSEKLLKENIERDRSEEGVDMCKALEDLYNDGIERGIKGMVQLCKNLNINKEEAIDQVSKELEVSREKAEESVEKYWK